MPAPRPRTTRLLGGRDAAPGTRGRDGGTGGGPGHGPGGGSSAVGSPVPARTFSGRFLILTLVAVLIVFLAAPTTKIFLEQRAEIAQLERAIADMEAQQASLEDQVDQWSDETYVKQRARDRLLYVMPGERSYLVVGAEEMDGAVVDSSAAQVEAEKPAWVDALWQSVVASAYEDARPAAGTGAAGDADADGEPAGSEDAGTAEDAGTDAEPGGTDEPEAPGQPGTTDEPGAAQDPGTTEQAEQTEQSVPAAPADGAGAPQDAATDSRGSAAE
ncbi:FtsB family cell division protein [Kocuria rosea]|uniref:Septum formation initiator family protein n=1 Tax=Kocuria rosea TaxID=1275 RepID=A0A4R5YCS1_KOCRO|nr:septum formation initiator family protein [Kocuria rosea]TDL42494.1 septum formation initiator family protein [Kocuria rosea]